MEVAHVTFSVFYLIKVVIRKGSFCWKPHLNRSCGSKAMSDWRILRTIEINFCFWLSDFWLISLDRNTNIEMGLTHLWSNNQKQKQTNNNKNKKYTYSLGCYHRLMYYIYAAMYWHFDYRLYCVHCYLWFHHGTIQYTSLMPISTALPKLYTLCKL